MKKPFVSVIIPNLNNAERLDRCLAALMKQTYPSDRREIILVDNGSTDTSIEISKKYPVDLLVESRYRSPYWCRNAGIQRAKGDYIVLLDSNGVPAPDWLAAGIEGLTNSTDAILTGPVHFQFSPAPTFAEKLDYLYSVITPAEIQYSTGLPATHLFIRSQLFQQLGQFIPQIRSLGDIEWTSRALKAGHTFGFSERAVITYPAKNWKKAIKKMVRLGGGKKELWVATGRSTLSPEWWLKILKNWLPPSAKFYQEMQQRNLREGTAIPNIQLWLGLWAIKCCRAFGMITKRTSAAPADNA